MMLMGTFFGIAGLTWALVFLRHKGLFGACVMEFLVASCFGYHFFHVAFRPVPLTADRLLLVALCALYAVFRLRGWVKPKPLNRADVALLAFIAILTANTFTHDWRFDDMEPVSNLLFYYYQPFALYWIARQSVNGTGDVRFLRTVLVVFSLYLAFTAVAELLHLTALVFPRYIVTNSVPEWIGRAQGPFRSPPTNGLIMGTILCCWLTYWPRATRWSRRGIAAAMGAVWLGVYCTLTRANWIGSVLGVWVVVLLVLPPRRRTILFVYSLVLAAVALPIASKFLYEFKREKNLSAQETALSVKLRPIIATLGWKVFLDDPWFGCGYGNFRKASINHLRDPESDLPLELGRGYVHHNMFMAMLADTGLTGFCCYLCVYGLWTRHALRLWRDRHQPLELRQLGLIWFGYLANLVMLGMFHNANSDLSIALLTFLLAGMIQGFAADSQHHGVPAAATLARQGNRPTG